MLLDLKSVMITCVLVLQLMDGSKIVLLRIVQIVLLSVLNVIMLLLVLPVDLVFNYLLMLTNV